MFVWEPLSWQPVSLDTPSLFTVFCEASLVVVEVALPALPVRTSFQVWVRRGPDPKPTHKTHPLHQHQSQL